MKDDPVFVGRIRMLENGTLDINLDDKACDKVNKEKMIGTKAEKFQDGLSAFLSTDPQEFIVIGKEMEKKKRGRARS